MIRLWSLSIACDGPDTLTTTLHATEGEAYRTLASEVVDYTEGEADLPEDATVEQIKDAAAAAPQFNWEITAHDVEPPQTSECKHCGRGIVLDSHEGWIDPEAGYDDENGDGIWRVTCERHDTFTGEHEPTEVTA